MADHALALLEDMLAAGRLIETYLVNVAFSTYIDDAKTQDAVNWRFMVIGEAARRLLRTNPEIAAQISELKNAIAYRNFLTHVYDAIDQRLVWETIQRSLPLLMAEVESTRTRLKATETK
jgi:uncharacterized protein with HEPN domain